MIYKCISNKCFDKIHLNDLNYNIHFTIDKNYEVIDDGNIAGFIMDVTMFKLRSDLDYDVYIPDYYLYQMFKSVEEIRESRLNKILK